MFRKVTYLLLVFIGTVTCTLSLISPALALEAGDIVMQARPAGQEIELVPGEVVEGSVTVANIGRLRSISRPQLSPIRYSMRPTTRIL